MAKCPSCNAEIPTGVRWCTICHRNVLNPDVGWLASPGRRLGACVLDGLLSLFAIGAILVTTSLAGEEENAGPCLCLGLLPLVAYGVWSLVLFAQGTSPGKKLLGMHVVREDGRRAGFLTMLIREFIGKPISSLPPLSLGYLWILFDSENQGWHDKIMRTYVVRR